MLDLTPDEWSTVLHEAINVTLIYNYAVILDEKGREEEAETSVGSNSTRSSSVL